MAQRLIALVILAVSVTWAQGTVSVMAGYINQVHGEALLDGEPVSTNPADLVHVRDGERLETKSGRVEIMLYPGSFMRVAPNSTVEMVNAGLLSAELRLVRGAAVIDLDELLEDDAVVVHAAEQGRVVALGSGVFRLDVPASGPARVRTLSGKAAVAVDGSTTVVKKGKEMGLAGGAAPAKTSAQPDELDKWQAARHQETKIAAANQRKKKGRQGGLDALDREILGMDQRRP